MNCNDPDNCKIRILDCGHEHYLHCDVDSKDFKCPTHVKAILTCDHATIKKPCHLDVNEWKCEVPCDARIEPCGHSCVRSCHVNHDPDHKEYTCYKTCDRVLSGCSTKTHLCQMYCYQKCSPCKTVVTKPLPNCNHLQALECSESGDKIVCEESCTKKIAECGHDCKRKCYEPCGGCDEMVMKTLTSCGHQVLTKCSELPNEQNCQGACSKSLPCGHLCQNKCNEVCSNECFEFVDHTNPTFCGHVFKIPCQIQTNEWPSFNFKFVAFCKEPCTAILNCLHKCSGNCVSCFHGRIHVPCKEKCGTTLICGHECKIPCREMCQPCQLPCGMKCSHSKCTKTCGEECTKCQESCTRRCQHVECTSRCGDICNVPPCQEPCQKKLPCLHPCVGFCGDPCPPLCKICNSAELTEVFLGHEDEDDARFVLLDECKHVIESRGMEKFFKQNGSNWIECIRCPKCRTPLTSTQRYGDYIKRVLNDIAVIKRKSIGSLEEIEAKRGELLVQFHDIKQFLKGDYGQFDEFIQDCGALLQPINKNKQSVFNLMIAKNLEAKLTIIQNIGNITLNQDVDTIYDLTGNKVLALEKLFYEGFLFLRIMENIERIITNQEIQDFEREQDRLQRITQFIKITNDLKDDEVQEIIELFYRPAIYTKDYDKIVKVKLEKCLKRAEVVERLTDYKRLEIVSATGLKKGHWFKCPNGHIYAIGECGGATEVGKCYECGVEIGGLNHSLLPSNSHAGEMDDSLYPAWSDIASNMLNYALDELQ